MALLKLMEFEHDEEDHQQNTAEYYLREYSACLGSRPAQTAVAPMSPAFPGPLLAGRTQNRASDKEKYVAARRRSRADALDLFALSTTEDIAEENLSCSLPILEPLELGAPAFPLHAGNKKSFSHVEIKAKTNSLTVGARSSDADSEHDSDKVSAQGPKNKQSYNKWSNFTRSHYPTRFDLRFGNVDGQTRTGNLTFTMIPEHASA